MSNRNLTPPKRDSSKTIFNTKLRDLYDDDWFKKLETPDYTDDGSYWVLEDEDTGQTLYTSSSTKAKWGEENDSMTVSIMWWE